MRDSALRRSARDFEIFENLGDQNSVCLIIEGLEFLSGKQFTKWTHAMGKRRCASEVQSALPLWGDGKELRGKERSNALAFHHVSCRF